MDKIKFKINPNEFKERSFTSYEISRGTGVHRVKKGKGSYNRKYKNKKHYDSGYEPTASYFCTF
jgi:hypothetical protein